MKHHTRIHKPQPVVRISRGEGEQSALAWIVPLLLLFIAAALLGYFYVLPKYSGHAIAAAKVANVEPLYQQIEALKEKNNSLIGELALARRSAEIDAEAGKKLLVTLSEREKEMRELKEELNFLKSMVSPEGARPGISIRSFTLSALDQRAHYAFKLVLIRVTEKGKSKAVKGTVKIRVQGRLNDESKALDWEDITTEEVDKLKFNFQFFQRVEGRLQFPEGFEPENILVKAELPGKKQPSIQQSYSWNSVLKKGG